MQETWPSDQSSDTVQAKAPDEDGFVAEVSQDPVGMAERSEWIGSCAMYDQRSGLAMQMRG